MALAPRVASLGVINHKLSEELKKRKKAFPCSLVTPTYFSLYNVIHGFIEGDGSFIINIKSIKRNTISTTVKNSTVAQAQTE